MSLFKNWISISILVNLIRKPPKELEDLNLNDPRQEQVKHGSIEEDFNV